MADLDANDLMLFARVVESGSFSRAAERMKLPKSTVSRHIAGMEKRLGEPLFLRSTRKLTITEFGASLVEFGRALAAEVDGALAFAEHRQVKPSGRLRVSMPVDLTNTVFPAVLARFVQDHPAIQLEMDLSARRVDLIGENFDLAVRIGDLPTDSLLAARKLAETSVGLYASPVYLRGVGVPKTPDDLLPLHGLLLGSRGGEPRSWLLSRAAGDPPNEWKGYPKLFTAGNSPTTLMKMAEAGCGVVALPDFVAKASVAQGILTRVLPEWSLPKTTYWAVFPDGRLMPSRTRVFLDLLISVMADVAKNAQN